MINPDRVWNVHVIITVRIPMIMSDDSTGISALS